MPFQSACFALLCRALVHRYCSVQKTCTASVLPMRWGWGITVLTLSAFGDACHSQSGQIMLGFVPADVGLCLGGGPSSDLIVVASVRRHSFAVQVTHSGGGLQASLFLCLSLRALAVHRT